MQEIDMDSSPHPYHQIIQGTAAKVEDIVILQAFLPMRTFLGMGWC